jgi:FKBP12-rapamycin complex-associated protein
MKKDEEAVSSNVLNKKALSVIERISSKLNGKDFENTVPLDVPNQVDRLIESATSHANLATAYIGFCSFW